MLLWDPFGQPVDPTTFAIGTATTDDAGQVAGNTLWHQGGLKQAESTGSTQVIEMGARLYVPALGRFLQVDPIKGGVDNDYVWPTDPINKADTNGQFWEWVIGGVAVVASVAAAVACGALVVCAIVAAVVIGAVAGAATYAVTTDSDEWTPEGFFVSAGIGALAGLVGGVGGR